MNKLRTVKSDEYSNHGLPIGAKVQKLDTANLEDWQRGVDWYTLGIDGDEVAIDPRDLIQEATT